MKPCARRCTPTVEKRTRQGRKPREIRPIPGATAPADLPPAQRRGKQSLDHLTNIDSTAATNTFEAPGSASRPLPTPTRLHLNCDEPVFAIPIDQEPTTWSGLHASTYQTVLCRNVVGRSTTSVRCVCPGTSIGRPPTCPVSGVLRIDTRLDEPWTSVRCAMSRSAAAETPVAEVLAHETRGESVARPFAELHLGATVPHRHVRGDGLTAYRRSF